jgi:hypothetical protein
VVQIQEEQAKLVMSFALQADAEVVPLWSSNLGIMYQNTIIDLNLNSPCTIVAKKGSKSLSIID